MNILPKKRWHVRTKENIARVRRDEAEAAEKERQEKLRIENADREARLHALKQKSRQHLLQCGVTEVEDVPEQSTAEQTQHINLFADLEHAVHTTNKEHDKEMKEKSEDYEKKIGYLTYLGQDTNEALKKKNWYEVLPEARHSGSTHIKETYDKLVLRDEDGKPKSKEIDEKYGEIGWKPKQRLDPINSFKKNCKQEQNIATYSGIAVPKHSKLETSKAQIKHKHNKDKNVEKEKKLQKLREARLRREQQEKHKTELFLSGLNGKPETTDNSEPPVCKVKAKYNSQFNPELARQNYNR